MKKFIAPIYIIIVLVLAVATIVEKYSGTTYVRTNIYGTHWFALLWAVLGATGTVHIVRMRVKSRSTLLLHLSFIIILIGAALTRFTAYTGTVHLRVGETTNRYLHKEHNGMEMGTLPFSLRLDRFRVLYHEGTETAADYESMLTMKHEEGVSRAVVSMNNIASFHGVCIYQSSYDDDRKGCTLSINSDPYGIPVTYTGYLLLFVSFVWMLANPHGTFRKLLGSDLLRKAFICILVAFPLASKSAPTFPRQEAEQFGRVYVNYNSRICPVQTLAVDFTRKLYGSASYRGYSAEQVLLGLVFWGNEWGNEPIIKIKSGELKSTLQLPDYCSINDFFKMGDYRLAPYIEELYAGAQDGFHKQAGDLDERIRLVLELRRGSLLKVFPLHAANGSVKWYAPTSLIPTSVDSLHRRYMQELFGVLNTNAQQGDYGRIGKLINDLRKYQVVNGRETLPTLTQTRAERIYNTVPFATVLFMVNLTLGILSLAWTIRRMMRSETNIKNNSRENSAKVSGYMVYLRRHPHFIYNVFAGLLMLSLLALTFALTLRWIVSGTVPMSNGYETMLTVAWFVQLLALLMYRKATVVLTFGFLLSGFFLLVSHISQMDPAITRIMPVLNSPLLSVHVGIIMMSYALLSLTFICGLTALLVRLFNRKKQDKKIEQIETLAVLSRIFLYPALSTLAFGIFVGAIWANISWGQYWSWDPKEVWALITLMVYAVPVHKGSLPMFSRANNYHLYITIAFITVLMTYFGVNYFLGGMHSYA